MADTKESAATSKVKVGAKQAPQTMDELLAQEGVVLKGIKRGDIVEGTVSQILPNAVFVDIGAKTEGMVVDKEFSAAKEYIKTLHEGDVIESYVLYPENESGQIILSLRNSAQEFNWNQIKVWHETNEILRVRVQEVNRGGAIVTVIDDITGFVPVSQFGEELAEKVSELVGKDIEVRILDFDRKEGKLILSEKNVSEAEDLEKRRALIAALEVGKKYSGVVTRVVPFGVFVQIDTTKGALAKVMHEGVTLEGLVHISELAWEKVDDPSHVASVGNTIEVKVISADAPLDKLSLSIKQLSDDPWLEIEKKFPADSQVEGRVTRVVPFGVFVELEKGVEGLIHISKLGSSDQTFEPGKKVKCYIESIDVAGRRISLGLVLTAVPIGYR